MALSDGSADWRARERARTNGRAFPGPVTTTIPVYNGGGTGSTVKAPPVPAAPTGPSPADLAAKAAADARAAEARAIARENAAKAKAGQRYLTQAGNLEHQATALKTALAKSFGSNRDIMLGNIGKNVTAQLGLLKSSHGERAKTFLDSAADNDKAAGGMEESGFSNLIRERQDAMTNILEQSAGETDAFRAMLLSARNWHANAQESNRNYFDTLRSVNSGITDLNVDTRSAMTNVHWDAEAERSRVWQDFYNKRTEAFQKIGDIRGQQADYYANAIEMGVKPKTGAEAQATKEMKSNYNAAAAESAKGYSFQGPGSNITAWKGQEQVEGRRSNTNLAAAVTLGPAAKAEGSTLRKWEG